MNRASKHFINRDLMAPNVREIDVDPAIIAQLSETARQLQHMKPATASAELSGGLRLLSKRPKWDSDVQWISQADRAGYDYFEALFRSLHIADSVAEYIAYDRRIVMYSGFFITRSFCNQPDFHRDWVDANNNAFTFIAPLSDNCSELGLAYRTMRGEVAQYQYRTGKGLVFGDHFHHSTAPGRTSEPTVLLSFTFGTDRMEFWPKIASTAARQGNFHCQPDGRFISAEQPPDVLQR